MTRLALIVALLAASTPALSATFSPVCKGPPAPTIFITDRLRDHYGEVRQRMLRWSSLMILEILANPATGSWTVLLTDQYGLSCIGGSGVGWHEIDPPI